MKNKSLALMGLGFELTGLIAVAAFLGQWLDQHFQMTGLATAGCVVLGFIIWIYRAVQTLKVPSEK